MSDWNPSSSVLVIDPHSLNVFREVAASGSFTRAGERVGLTQSAVTRQIQALEEMLGLKLFDRTTRRVDLTAAGKFLLAESSRWTRDVERSMEEMRERFADAPKTIRVGVSRSITYSYLPGFFAGFRRKNLRDRIDVRYDTGQEIYERVLDDDLDIGVCANVEGKVKSPQARALEVTHRFIDRFVVIAPPAGRCESDVESMPEDLPMIRFSAPGVTCDLLESWRLKLRPKGEAGVAIAMEADSFDLVINLVSLGFGWSVVPKRALAIYGRRKPVRRIAERDFPQVLPEREVVIVARRDRARPEHLREFVREILF